MSLVQTGIKYPMSTVKYTAGSLMLCSQFYLKRCRSRAVKIIKDSNHPGNCLFTLLPSGKRFRSLIAKTERLRRSFFPKAIRLLNSLYLIFYSFYFMYTSLVLYFSIFALSMERTRLSFHCWLYNLCIVVYVTNKT